MGKIYRLKKDFELGLVLRYKKESVEKTATLSFRDGGILEVKDNDMCSALEKTFYFKKGDIEILKEDKENPAVSDGDILETKMYEDVTDLQSARDILKKEYGIAPVALNSPEKIKSQAEKHFVVFPNLNYESSANS
jgi:hypothetical protein